MDTESVLSRAGEGDIPTHPDRPVIRPDTSHALRDTGSPGLTNRAVTDPRDTQGLINRNTGDVPVVVPLHVQARKILIIPGTGVGDFCITGDSTTRLGNTRHRARTVRICRRPRESYVVLVRKPAGSVSDNGRSRPSHLVEEVNPVGPTLVRVRHASSKVTVRTCPFTGSPHAACPVTSTVPVPAVVFPT